jgi:multicomponent K+:H+ antiporter subunit E
MNRSFLPHPLLTPLLALIWLLLNNTLAPGHVFLGILLGWLIPLFTLRFWPETVRIRKPWTLVRFLAVFILDDVFVANLAVARRILGSPASVCNRPSSRCPWNWKPISLSAFWPIPSA